MTTLQEGIVKILDNAERKGEIQGVTALKIIKLFDRYCKDNVLVALLPSTKESK